MRNQYLFNEIISTSILCFMTCTSESNLIILNWHWAGQIYQSTNIFLQTFFIIFLIRLRVGLIHLRDHKLRHYFRDLLNPICNCGNAIESIKHYFLHYLNFKNERQSLLQNVRTINSNLLSANQEALSHLAKACNFIKKESLAQVFSCEFCEISKDTFFNRTPPVPRKLIIFPSIFRNFKLLHGFFNYVELI